MEYAVAAGIVVLCLGCAYFGYRLGVKNRQTTTIERVAGVSTITHDVAPATKPEVTKDDAQQEWMSYNSKYNGD